MTRKKLLDKNNRTHQKKQRTIGTMGKVKNKIRSPQGHMIHKRGHKPFWSWTDSDGDMEI